MLFAFMFSNRIIEFCFTHSFINMINILHSILVCILRDILYESIKRGIWVITSSVSLVPYNNRSKNSFVKSIWLHSIIDTSWCFSNNLKAISGSHPINILFAFISASLIACSALSNRNKARLCIIDWTFWIMGKG